MICFHPLSEGSNRESWELCIPAGPHANFANDEPVSLSEGCDPDFGSRTRVWKAVSEL